MELPDQKEYAMCDFRYVLLLSLLDECNNLLSHSHQQPPAELGSTL